MIRNIDFKKVFFRLLLTGIGQILLIVLWMQIPGQEAAGYLLLLLLMGIPVGAISNALIKKYIIYLMTLTDSILLKKLIPFLIIIAIFVVYFLLIITPVFSFLYIVIFYMILSLPLLAIEMIFYLIKQK